jgi:N-methylhydantoinase A
MALGVIEAALAIRARVGHDMANGIAQELRVRGSEPRHFTLLAYGGNGALHCCAIANALGIDRVLVPPFSSMFSAVGASNMDQLHIHERSLYLSFYDSNTRRLYEDFQRFNAVVAELEARGRDDLLRQGYAPTEVEHRLELDMRYGNQLAQTAVVAAVRRLHSAADLLAIIEAFARDYGQRYGEGSQAPEAGIRVNTVRVASYVKTQKLHFSKVLPRRDDLKTAPPAREHFDCHFAGTSGAIRTPFHRHEELAAGSIVIGPAVVVSASTTFLVEPGWRLTVGEHGCGWFERSEENRTP